jgi:hypothetical protein
MIVVHDCCPLGHCVLAGVLSQQQEASEHRLPEAGELAVEAPGGV